MKGIFRVALMLLVPVVLGTLVLGAKPDRIKSAHPVHAANEVGCETCHAAAASTSGTDNLLPPMETCGGCHDIESDDNCKQCHTNTDEPAVAPRRTSTAQKFPHKTHLDRGLECAECHGNTAEAEPHIPSMTLCRSCHETASDLADCAVCHAASEPLVPVSHTNNWRSYHATVAHAEQGDCASCHTQKDCQDCHNGDNVRPRVHRLNFLFNHGVEARGKEMDCATCHEDAGFCQSCHQERRVMPRDHSRADWVEREGGGRHAEEGRFDLETCVGCHDTGNQAPVCAQCHGR